MKPTYAAAVTERLAAMQGYLEELAPLAAVSLEEYLSDSRLRRAAERLVQLVVESASDAARMLMLGRHYNPGPSHVACLQNMAKRHLISRNLADRLIEYVSLRNVVVHDYLTLDDEMVYRQVQNAEAVFGEFLEQMKEALGRGKRRK
jgi:uncharacterized protein YutE (UPF0331/DUF86 family)